MLSKKEMVQNLAKSVKDYTMNGFKTVDEEILSKRLEICQGCEHLSPELNRCQLCGCFTKLKAKLKSSKCPIGKWEV